METPSLHFDINNLDFYAKIFRKTKDFPPGYHFKNEAKNKRLRAGREKMLAKARRSQERSEKSKAAYRAKIREETA